MVAENPPLAENGQALRRIRLRRKVPRACSVGCSMDKLHKKDNSSEASSTGFNFGQLKFIFLLLLFIISLLFFFKKNFDRFELVTLDWRFRLRAEQVGDPRLVFIDIKEDSLKSLGRWPFDRKYHAFLIEALTEAQASAIVFDILFSEESPSDMELIVATKKAGSVFYPVAFKLPKGRRSNEFDAPLIKELREVCAGYGHINIIPDIDGKMRRVPLFIRYNDEYVPHLSLSVALRELDIPLKEVRKEKHSIKLGEKINIPVDEQRFCLINYLAPWGRAFKHYSYSDVVRSYYQIKKEHPPLLDLSLFKDKICFIGLTATGTHDLRSTPLEKNYAMVGIHANLVNSFLQNKFLRCLGKWSNSLLGILLILAVLYIVNLKKYPIVVNFCLYIGLVLIWIIFVALAFVFFGIWIKLVFPLALSLFLYLGITGYKFIIEEKEKRWIRKAFSHYVSGEIMEEILKDPAKLRLGGERRIITVLFSDIRGFTTYSEKRKPEETVNILNEYLDAMTKVIFKNKGTLDKYVGDEIMALFGAPAHESPEICAQRALRTACEMMDVLKQLQEKWVNEGKAPLDIGIGVNTGEMVVGNMGSTLVMDYTVIGDAVNLGARVEALTRQFNNHIIITEFTYAYVKDIIEAKPLESIKVKGKDIPVMIYEVIGLKPENSE